MKKKKCSGTKGYNCGSTCISVKYECRKEALGGQSVSISTSMTQMINSAGGGKTSSAKPKTKSKQALALSIADSPERTARRSTLIDKYFGGDEAKAKEWEQSVTEELSSLKPKMIVSEYAMEFINKESGKLKNIFETGYSKGENDQDLRRNIELDQFGFDGQDSDAPKYGFLETSFLPQMSNYGENLMEANDIKSDEFTVTFGDSLMGSFYGDPPLYNSKADDIKIESFEERSLDNIIGKKKVLEHMKESGSTINYVEVQYFGELNINQFTKIGELD